MRFKSILAFVLIATISASCAGKFDIFPPIDGNMSNPVTLAIDSTRNRLYINNSNYRVNYDDGSVHVVDITDLTNMVRVDFLVTPSFSGQMFFDPATQLLYTPNRFSSTELDREDTLFQINVNEASGNFLARADYPSRDDPYGIAYYATNNWIFTAAEQGYIDWYDLDASLTRSSQTMSSVLDSGATFSGAGATRVITLGTQAIVTRSNGGLWLVNIDQLGVDGTYPIDYLIGDVETPQGIKGLTAGGQTYVYVVSVDFNTDPVSDLLLVIDISSLTPRTDNTTTLVVDKDGDVARVAMNRGGKRRAKKRTTRRKTTRRKPARRTTRRRTTRRTTRRRRR